MQYIYDDLRNNGNEDVSLDKILSTVEMYDERS